MKTILLSLFLLFAYNIVLADEIYLKDNTTIKCKIIQVNGGIVEYDPEGEKPFLTVEAGQVLKIVYDGGKIEYLAEDSGDTVSDIEDENRFYPYSKSAAFFSSLIPGWSGSWRVGFTKPGLLFVIAKTAGIFGNLCFSTIYYEEHSKKADYFAFLWLGATVADMIYSPIRIHIYNSKMMESNHTFYNREDNFSITLSPMAGPKGNKIDGVNLSFNFSF